MARRGTDGSSKVFLVDIPGTMVTKLPKFGENRRVQLGPNFQNWVDKIAKKKTVKIGGFGHL
jgi:hypothetical protein